MIINKAIKLFCFLFLFIIIRNGNAQNWLDLSIKDRYKVEKKWIKWTNLTTITTKDDSIIQGQIIFPIDSGIILRNVPQYISYDSSNVQLVKFGEISSLKSSRSSRLSRHAINGALIGGVLSSSYSYFSPHRPHNPNLLSWVIYSGIGYLGGMTLGILSGTLIDKTRSNMTVYSPNVKNTRFLSFMNNTLYSHKKEGFWRKHWIKNDSLIGGYALPPTLDKLRPHYRKRFHFDLLMGMRGMRQLSFNTENGKAEYYYEVYHYTPRFLEARLSYQLKPWLKLGVQTHKTKTDTDYIKINHSSPDINFHNQSDGSQKIVYNRSLGFFIEYTPFPVKYLNLRRNEFYLGIGIMRESGVINYNLSSSYLIPDDYINFQYRDNKEFVLPGLMGYTGMSVHLNSHLSIRAQLGYYSIPRYQEKRFTIDIVEPYQDIIFNPNSLNLSQAYLGLSLSM